MTAKAAPLCLGLLTAALILMLPLQTSHAGEKLPFHAAFDTLANNTPPDPIIHVQVTGTGEATHLGRTTCETTDQTLDTRTGTGTATYYLTAANGDQLIMTFQYSAPPLAPDVLALLGTWQIVGGTGRFAEAAGSGTLEGSVKIASATEGIGQFDLTGTISYGKPKK